MSIEHARYGSIPSRPQREAVDLTTQTSLRVEDDSDPFMTAEHLRLWLRVVAAAALLLWLPALVKLFLAGNLGCGDNGCWYDVTSRLRKNTGHMIQGALLAIVLVPWCCKSGRLGCRGCRSGRCSGADPGAGRHLKNSLMMLGLVYPVYNLISNYKDSCIGAHPQPFWDSTFFISSMDIAFSFTVSSMVGVLLLWFWLRPKSPRVFGTDRDTSTDPDPETGILALDGYAMDQKYASSEDSFWWFSVLLLMGLSGVTVASLVLSTKSCWRSRGI